MDSKEIHRVMRDRLPVVYDGRRFDRILEFVASYDDRRNLVLSLGLLQGRHLYRVPAANVELAEK